MRVKKINDAIKNFFESSAIKDTFDNIRNIGLASLVIYVGFYMDRIVTPKASLPKFVQFVAFSLEFIGLLLAFICAVHGYYLIKKSISKKYLSLFITIVLAPIYVSFIIASLHMQGLVL